MKKDFPARISPRDRERLRLATSALLEWYAANRKHYFWRKREPSAYLVLVSEFMLQQTQAKTIEVRLPIFLKQFPSFEALAAAPRADVLRAWQGLGYNRRAINLHEAAKRVVEDFGGKLPNDVERLRSLPGVGKYTASATVAFVYNADVAVVDVNVERVLSRLWKRMPDHAAALPMKQIESLDAAILPSGRSSEWHQALMDLGSSICTRRNPRCEVCPLLEQCASGARFIRMGSSAAATRRAGREPHFFGEPRRIWRGRVLKLIAAKPQNAKLIERRLAQAHGIDSEAFADFIHDIAQRLTDEGFIVRRGPGTLELKA